MSRRSFWIAAAFAALGLALPVGAVTIPLGVTSGGVDSQNTRTCTSNTCGTAVWSLASGEQFLATGSVTIDTTTNQMVISLAVASSMIDADPSLAQVATDFGASALIFTNGTYTATVGITPAGGGVYTINAGQTGLVSFTNVTAVGAGAGAPLSASVRLTGGCLLDASNNGTCGFTFGSTPSTPFHVSGAGFGTYDRYIRHTLDVNVVVPEPASVALLGLGALGLLVVRRRFRR